MTAFTKKLHRINIMVKTLLSLLPLLLAFCGSAPHPVSKPDVAGIYAQAIGDFIRAANQKNAAAFDTLYFGKRQNGQPDDFPDIALPETIEHTVIKLIAPELGEKLQQERKSRVYINLMGWVEEQSADFFFVVFSNGFEHQYDYTLNYQYNPEHKAFELKQVQFKGPPFDK